MTTKMPYKNTISTARNGPRWTIISLFFLLNMILFATILSFNFSHSKVECKQEENTLSLRNILKAVLFGNFNTKKNTQSIVPVEEKVPLKSVYMKTRHEPMYKPKINQVLPYKMPYNDDHAVVSQYKYFNGLQSNSIHFDDDIHYKQIEEMISDYNSNYNLLFPANKHLLRRNGYSSSYAYEPPCYGFPLVVNIRSIIKPEDIFPIKGNSQVKKCIKLEKPPLRTPDHLKIRLNFKPTPSPEPYPASNYKKKYSTGVDHQAGIYYDER